MQPASSHDFLKVAFQRFTAAEALLNLGITLDAQYIGGYTVECSLKALILEKTPVALKEDMLKKISSGQKMHRVDVLLGKLKDLQVTLTNDLAKRMRRFDWTTDLRHEIGRRDKGETIALLRTATAIYDWVKGQIPCLQLPPRLLGKTNGQMKLARLRRFSKTPVSSGSTLIAITRR